MERRNFTVNNHRHSEAPGPEPTSTKPGATKETPMKTPLSQYYLTLTRSVRGGFILFATLTARAALRLPIPNQFE